MNSDEFILFSLKSYLARKRIETEDSVVQRGNDETFSKSAKAVRVAPNAAVRGRETNETISKPVKVVRKEGGKPNLFSNAADDNREIDETFSKSVKVVREAGGKPYLFPHVAEFSLTHTDGFLAAAFSETPVGIDVENLRRFRMKKRRETNATENKTKTERGESGAEYCSERCGGVPLYQSIARRFFGIAVDGEEAFFKLWTKREAEAKRDNSFLFDSAEDAGATEFFTVGDFLIAVAYR